MNKEEIKDLCDKYGFTYFSPIDIDDVAYTINKNDFTIETFALMESKDVINTIQQCKRVGRTYRIYGDLESDNQ